MNQVMRAVVACLLLGILSDGSLPHASAQSTDDPAALPPSSALPVPAFPANRTGVIPLDRALDDAAAQYVAFQRTVGETYTTVAAAIHDASKGIVKEPLVLYADGAASLTSLDGTATDPRKGGYGAWAQVGDQPWRPDPGAAKSGLSGFTVAQPSGGYAGGQHSLLLTPQLDLQTDLLDPELANTGLSPRASSNCQPGLPGDSVASIWSSVFQRVSCGLNGSTYVDCQADPRFIGCYIPVKSAVTLDPRDAPFKVQFKARYNLGVNSGTNQDGVALLVFTEPPTAAQVRDRLVPDGCVADIHCTVVLPFTNDPIGTQATPPATPAWYKAVRAMEDQDGGSHLGFAGTQGWATYSVDLGRWAGQRVWLGFYFASSPLLNPRTYFSSPSYFNQTAGFYGFQMDDVVLTAPGPAVSLRVLAPLDEPNDHPDPGQPQRTVVAPGEPFQVRPTLLNTGASAFHVKTHMELRTADGTLVTTGDHPAIFMEPGSMTRLAFPVPALPAASGYQLRVAAERVSVSPVCPDALANLTVCAPQPCPDVPQEPGCLPSDPDPANDVLDTTFDVAAIHNLAAGELTRSAPLIPHVGSGSVAFTLPITNLGNQPENVTAAACVVVLQAAPVCGQGPDFFDPQTPGAAAPVLLAPLEAHTFQWSAIPAQAGQYRLFVRVATGSIDAVPAFAPADLATLRAPNTTASPDFRYRALGLGFGVERSPPAIFAQDFSAGCPTITTDPLLGAPWTRSDELSKDGRTEAWACGPYGPDGKQVLYEGTTDGAHHSELRTFPEGISLTQVATPAFTIPNIPDPYLFLEHQYATESWIVDESGPTPTGYKDFGNSGSGIQTTGIEVKSRGLVYLDVSYDGGDSWARRYLLQPEDGYTSEEQIGIANPERNGRDGRPALASNFEVNACDRPENLVTPDHVDKGIKNCGFWWPTGLQPLYRPAGSNYTTGATFSGSPWLVDRFPLFGVRMQNVTGDALGKGTERYARIAAAGNTARLVLDFARSAPPTADSPFPAQVLDYGWRVGGMAVVEGGRLQRDLALEGIGVEAPLYDPATLGVAPGSSVPVQLTVRNTGRVTVQHLTLHVEGRDPAAPGTTLCSANDELDAVLLPGAVANFTLACGPLPASGARVQFQGSATPEGGDDFPADNVRADRHVLPLRAAPDAGVAVAVSPASGPAGQARRLAVTLQNRGNLDLTGLELRLRVKKAGEGSPALLSKAWSFAGTLPVGATMSIEDARLKPNHAILPEQDLVVVLPDAGDYAAVAQVEAAGDGQPLNDAASAALVAMDVLYSNGFDNAPVRSPLVGAGGVEAQAPWNLTADGVAGTQGLVAGANGRIPLGSNATVTFPTIDLSAARGATLTLTHQYDLETSFDGGRVEISTDAGKTWRPLRPLPDLVQGLPDGYPSMALLGTSPLLDGQPAQEAAAYTGRSADLPGATGGFATASFDLAQDPTLHARGPIDAFHQDGFAVAPAARPLAASDGPRFTDPSWQLQEKDALARQRYWWVDNATYGIDAHPGRQLWWSGSAGDEGARGVDNALRSGLIPVTAARPGDALRLTWWDWRAGAGDGDPTLRSGTGGDFTVRVLDGDTATVLAARVVATEPSGWTERSADLTAFVGKSVEIEFAYHSVLAAGDKRARLQDNLGWFVDGMRLESLQRLPGQGLGNPVLACSDPCDANGWTARAPTLAGSPAWTRAVPGDAARPGGWHVEAQEVPGKGQVATWRFSGPGAQGYPNGADSRLVTPVVDLAGLGSSAVRLTFDQQVGLESRRVCAGFGTSDCEGSFLSALDGGAVEVQVYNATTDSFGPWQQVGARFRSFPDALLFESLQPPLVNPETGHECASAASETGCRLRQPDRLSNLKQGPVANRDLLAGTGYTAIEERGHAARGILTGTVFSVDERAIPVGHGTSFEAHNALVRKQWTGLVGLPHTYTDGWTPYPVSYVFSGQGAGWQAVDWDIGPLAGQRVRFGFHVATNPSLTAPAADGHPYHGWSVANVAILGDLFQGKAAQVRLHLATDGSVERGQWSVDDVAVSGQRHASQVVVLPDSPLAVRALPDAPVTLAGHVANLGLAAQDGLAIAVRATGPGGVVLPVGLTGGALRPADPASRPAGLDGWSLFTVPGSSLTLYAAGVAGGNATQGFEIHLAAPAGEASVRVLALQARNRTAPGASGPVPVYEALRNDGGRDGAQVWSVVGEDTVHLVAVPPRAGSSDLLPTSRQGTAYTVQGQVLNDGTREARADVQWTFRQVFSKGSAAQPNTREDLGPILKDTLIHLGYVQPGASAPSQATFSPPAHGLYRAQADYYLEGVQDAVATVRTEFLDGLPSQHYAADFSTGMQNWTAQATEPSEIRFRQVGAALVWGTDDGQEAPDGYCSFAPGCNRQAGASNAPPVVGLEGIVGSPRIDLRRVPAGQATVTLTHQGSFTEGDGFQLEAVPYYLLGAAWTPAFTCSGAPGTPMGFVVPPIAPTATTLAYSLPSERLGGNQYAPTRTHPLNPSTAGGKVPILGGTTPLHTDSFDLGAVLKSTCDGTSARLVNYTVELRLHAGTRPGVDYTNGVVRTIERTGGTGLQATALSVSSAGATAFPAAQSYPVQAGAAKSFTFLLRNTGQAADAFTLGFEAAAFRPEWVRFPVPVVALAAGEARLVTFTVDVPGDTPLGAATYPGLVLARSVASPGIVATLRAALVVDPIRLPDLVAGPLSTDPAGGAFQTGTSGFVFSTIRNLGTLGALPAQVRLLASPADDPDAAPTVVETRPLPALCPALDCGDGGQATLQFEWVPPSTPGDVVLTVAIESSGAELSLANNRAALRVTVQPQTVPDVAVTSLVVEGVGKDGYAESGTLLVMRANVTNLGFAPASGVRVRMLSNASELLQQTIPALAPGQTVAVTAYKVASDGAFVLKAFAFPPANDPRTDNQELRRAVRVRTHGLSLGVGNLTVAPGEAATALLQVRNGGNGIERVLLSNGTAAGWGFAFTPNPVLVAPHSQTVVVVTVQAPQNASGLHRLQVLAAPAARPALQSTASLNVTVETLDGSPLLTATSVAAAPGRVAVPVKITSRTNVTQALTIGLGSPAWAAAPVRVALPAGGAKSTTLWVEVPPSAAVGAHPLALRVTDAANRTVAEAATVLTVQPSPAVHAAWQGGSRGLSGDPTLRRVELKLGLNNTGNVPEQVTLAPRDLAPGLAALAPPLVEALAPGESRTVPILLDVSGDAPASLYGLVEVWAAHLDANGTHEPRLAAALPLPAFLDAADLHIKRLDILPRGVAHAGDVLRVTATVENQGSQAAPATRLDAYVNGDLLAAIDVPALAPGAQATLTLNASFASAGTYLLVLKSDGAGIVQEMEKDNNAVSQAVTLDPPALLSPEYLHEKAPAAGLAFALLLLLVAAFVRRRRDA